MTKALLTPTDFAMRHVPPCRTTKSGQPTSTTLLLVASPCACTVSVADAAPSTHFDRSYHDTYYVVAHAWYLGATLSVLLAAAIFIWLFRRGGVLRGGLLPYLAFCAMALGTILPVLLPMAFLLLNLDWIADPDLAFLRLNRAMTWFALIGSAGSLLLLGLLLWSLLTLIRRKRS